MTVSFRESLSSVPVVIVGGMPISVLDRDAAARLMIVAARAHRRGDPPFFFTSANGEVIARASMDGSVAALFQSADQILADGQPLVLASRWLCRMGLPERVATTDLFHDVARLAEQGGETFYLFGSTEEENRRAAEVIAARYPGLRIVGRSNGYLSADELMARLREINELSPDILWLGLGVPREQSFVRDHAQLLANVGVIKTAGGLFNHLSGRRRRAPLVLQKAGLEWLWRMMLEPRRLFWRYLTTNPRAFYAILRNSR